MPLPFELIMLPTVMVPVPTLRLPPVIFPVAVGLPVAVNSAAAASCARAAWFR